MQKKTESPRFRVNIGLVKSAFKLLGQMLADGDERARFADQGDASVLVCKSQRRSRPTR